MIPRLFAVMVLAGAISPCALGAAEKPIELVLWQGFKFNEVTLLKRQIDDFAHDWQTRHGTSITITAAQVPFPEMINKLKFSALARQTPDLAFVDANAMVPLAFGQIALALDTVSNFPPGGIEGLRPKYVPGAFATNIVSFKGAMHLYGLPAQTNSLVLYYNKKMFSSKAEALRSAGCDPDRAPRDWDEFIKYGKVLTEPAKGLYAFGMNNSLWYTMPFFNEYQVDLVHRRPDGLLEGALKGERAIAAAQRKANFWLRDKVEGGAWREGSLDPDQGFLNEKYAMVLDGPWMIENFRSSGLDFGVALIPKVPMDEARKLGLIDAVADSQSTSVEHLSAGNIGGQNLMVCSRTKHPEAALEFALFFSGEKVQRQWAEELGQIPVYFDAQKNLDLTRFPEIPTFIQQVNLSKPEPPLPYGSSLETEIFNPEFNLLLQGKQSAEQALSRANSHIEKRILKPLNEIEFAERRRRSN